MNVEWDVSKNAINIDKHGIHFNDVCLMSDHVMLTQPDKQESYEKDHRGEQRWIGIGWLKSILVVVVYVDRQDNIRIISARKATKNEGRHYEQFIKN